MAVKIRQEINILDAILSAAGGSSATSNEIVQLDTTQYVNPTYYFEAVADSTVSISFNVTLRRKGTSTDDATVNIPLLTTSYTRKRSSSFSPPAGQTEYVVQIDNTVGATKNVKAARIIIIDNPTTLTSAETQIEIGNNETSSATSANPLVSPKYWLYTAANWSGGTVFYAEVTYAGSNSKSSIGYTLQEDNGSFASWTDKVTIVSAGAATTPTRVRSAAFTPTDGRHYRLKVDGTNLAMSATVSTYNAKVIVDQSNAFVFNNSGLSTDSNTLSPTLTGTAQSFTGNGNKIISVKFNLKKFGSPTGNAVAKIYAHSGTFGSSSVPTGAALATSDNLDASTLGTNYAWATLTFSGANQFQTVNGTNYCISIEFTGTGTDSITVHQDFNNDFPGNRSDLTSGTWAASATTDQQIQIFDNVNTQVTLLEAQYLLLNTGVTSGGILSYQTLWDSTEWAGVTNTYKHAIDTGGADGGRLLDIDNSNAVVTNSSITATAAGQTISSALTMPTSGHQIDIHYQTVSSALNASRILAVVSVNATTTLGLQRIISDIQNTPGTMASQAPQRASYY